MTFCIVGAHRSGKTTLAKKAAETLGIHFFQSNVGERMKAAGYDMVSDMSISDRLNAQFFLLDSYVKELDDLPRPFITDRSPIDMLAYLLAEIPMHNGLSAADDVRIMRYRELCHRATSAFFDTVVCIRPFGEYVNAPGKPPFSNAYQHHIQHLIESSMFSVAGEVTVVVVTAIEFDERVDDVVRIISERMGEMTKARNSAVLH